MELDGAQRNQRTPNTKRATNTKDHYRTIKEQSGTNGKDGKFFLQKGLKVITSKGRYLLPQLAHRVVGNETKVRVS